MPRFMLVRYGPYTFEREAPSYEEFLELAAAADDEDWTPSGPDRDGAEEYMHNDEADTWEPI